MDKNKDKTLEELQKSNLDAVMKMPKMNVYIGRK